MCYYFRINEKVSAKRGLFSFPLWKLDIVINKDVKTNDILSILGLRLSTYKIVSYP